MIQEFISTKRRKKEEWEDENSDDSINFYQKFKKKNGEKIYLNVMRIIFV